MSRLKPLSHISNRGAHESAHPLFHGCGILAVGATLMLLAAEAQADIIIDASTRASYNNSIGFALDGSSDLFPELNTDDPTIESAPEPDWSLASQYLGDWLDHPQRLGRNWSGPRTIPANWEYGTETAIVYEFHAADALTDFTVDIGIDNGAFVWLDGEYLGGHVKPGGAYLGELSLGVDRVSAGTHYLQILREDHGGSNGFMIRVQASAVPEPGSLWLLGIPATAMGLVRRRQRRRPA